MATNDSDAAWRHYGETDPYFGVLTQDRYRDGAISDVEKAEFFRSGTEYVDDLMLAIRDQIDSSFVPRRALDFGCGVGRLTLPIARLADQAVGVDISEGMLAEAARNAEQQHVTNVTWVVGDDGLSRVTGHFDFVHSFIVLQHIPPKRGQLIFARMIDLLVDGGVGALHCTYAYSTTMPFRKRALVQTLERVPFANGVRNVIKGAPYGQPIMRMGLYPVDQLVRLLHERGCHRISLRPTETSHFGYPLYGVTICFAKMAVPVDAHS